MWFGPPCCLGSLRQREVRDLGHAAIFTCLDERRFGRFDARAEHAGAQAHLLLRRGERDMRVGQQLANLARGGQRIGDLGHRFLADDRRHVDIAPRGRQGRRELGDPDHRFVDGVFGLMQFGGDLLRRGKSFVQHVFGP